MEEELLDKLTKDLKALRIPIEEVGLEIRPFSTTYYGRYFPSINERRAKPKIFLYPYKNNEGELYEYEKILEILIHEMVHHIQYTSPSFVRVKGIMHDPNFWKLYNRYLEKAEDFGIYRKESLNGA